MSSVPEQQLDPKKIINIDLADEELRQNFVHRMAEWALHPPFYAVHGETVQVICGRYADAVEVYGDRDRFSVNVPQKAGFERFDKFMGVRTLSQLDGERHDRLRKLMAPPFNPSRLAQLEKDLRRVMSELLDGINVQDGGFDAMKDFASHIMPRVLLEVMFGMNAEQQRAFRKMSEVIPLATRIPPGGTFPPEYVEAFATTRAVINTIIEERRANPGEDFISTLIQSKIDGDFLTPTELYDQIFTVTVGALQSTASSLGSVLYMLTTHPTQFDLVKADRTLIPAAIEESLRRHMPGFLSFPRFALTDTEVGGTKIMEGMVVRVSPQAAALDPTVYPDPLKLDVKRKLKAVPTFGLGMHTCLGNRLARMVIRMSLEGILERFPGIRIADDNFTPRYRGQVSETQLISLPLKIS
jgi:cytochrome P450